MWIRGVIIRLCLPLVWSHSRKRVAGALSEFSRTEIDSAWQSLHAMKHVDDPKLRAKLFQHALEELHHGSLFFRAATQYSENHPSAPIGERILLYDPAKGDKALVDFYAAETSGETNVKEEFDSYAAASPYKDLSELFLNLKQDEIGHAIYTNQVFNQLTGGSRWLKAWWAIKIQARRFYNAWIKFGAALGHVMPSVLLGTLYLIFGATFRSLCRNQIDRSYEWENERLRSGQKPSQRRAA